MKSGSITTILNDLDDASEIHQPRPIQSGLFCHPMKASLNGRLGRSRMIDAIHVCCWPKADELDDATGRQQSEVHRTWCRRSRNGSR